MSPRCDPLTFVPLFCDHKRDWHLIGLWLTCCVTVVSSDNTLNVWNNNNMFLWCFSVQQTTYRIVVVVVVVFFTLTHRTSTMPSNIRGCQSGTWSQRGTKVNGSHHGDNPLLRPTGIQVATKSYATLQAMPTNNKTVHQTSLFYIESSLDRLGLLSPTHDQRSQQQIGQIRSNRFRSTINPSFSRLHIVH